MADGCSAGGEGVAVSEEVEVAGWGEGEEKVSGGYRRVSECRSLEGAIGRPRLVAFSQLSHQELVLHSSPHSLSLLHPNPAKTRLGAKSGLVKIRKRGKPREVQIRSVL